MQYVKVSKSGSIIVTSHFKLSMSFLSSLADEEKSLLLKLVEYLKQTESVELTYFIYASRATLNFRKFKVALNPLRRTFLNFAKSCILSY